MIATRIEGKRRSGVTCTAIVGLSLLMALNLCRPQHVTQRQRRSLGRLLGLDRSPEVNRSGPGSDLADRNGGRSSSDRRDRCNGRNLNTF
jgi:hypothetical protein